MLFDEEMIKSAQENISAVEMRVNWLLSARLPTTGTIRYRGGTYIGELLDKTPHGQGAFTDPDGSKYVGQFKNGNMRGQGTMTHADGRKFVGEWKNGEMRGQVTFPDRSKYVGEFKDGKPWEGTHYDKDGNVIATWSEGGQNPFN